MNAIFATLLMFVSVAAPGIAASAAEPTVAPNANAQTAVQLAYDAECNALEARDFTRAANILAPDYAGAEVDNARSTRDDFIGGLAMIGSHYQVQQCGTKVLSVLVNGSPYTVSIEQTIGGQALGTLPQSVTVVTHQNDAWQQIRGEWKIVSTAVIERTVSVNGRVISHQVRQTPASGSRS